MNKPQKLNNRKRGGRRLPQGTKSIAGDTESDGPSAERRLFQTTGRRERFFGTPWS